jgi:hypothetical protein
MLKESRSGLWSARLFSCPAGNRIAPHLTARANLSNREAVTTYALESAGPHAERHAAKGKN